MFSTLQFEKERIHINYATMNSLNIFGNFITQFYFIFLFVFPVLVLSYNIDQGWQGQQVAPQVSLHQGQVARDLLAKWTGQYSGQRLAALADNRVRFQTILLQ